MAARLARWLSKPSVVTHAERHTSLSEMSARKLCRTLCRNPRLLRTKTHVQPSAVPCVSPENLTPIKSYPSVRLAPRCMAVRLRYWN
jgi:hypothetical protein